MGAFLSCFLLKCMQVPDLPREGWRLQRRQQEDPEARDYANRLHREDIHQEL